MARMLHRSEPPAEGQKVFIAVAAYEGCGAGFTWSLFHTGAELARAGIAHELAIYSGNCHVDDSRNRLARDFLNSDCTDMVFLDADIGWQAKDFTKLLSFDRDIVAGVYPKKHGDDSFPMRMLPGEIWSDRDGLIEVEGVPTGFLRIRRGVMEALATSSQIYNAKNDGAYGTACIFERQIHEGTRWGGDYVFCRKARAAGFKIYIDPAMRFEHSGEHTWTGQAGAWLRHKAGIGLPMALAKVRDAEADAEVYLELFDAWANPFAAAPPLLAGLGMLAREAKGPILECGAGLSSLVMAAANPSVEVHALEDSAPYAEHLRQTAEQCGLANLHVHCRPLKDGWYDKGTLPDADWALVFIDGPRRAIGGRAEATRRLDLSRSVVVADDIATDDCGVAGLLEAIQVTHDVLTFRQGVRAFVIGSPKSRNAARAA